jgi:hypothetical protein
VAASPRHHLRAPLRHVELDLHLRQIRSPAHSLAKRSLQTRHTRVLACVCSSLSGFL